VNGPAATTVGRDAFPALAAELRPELHRYCARLTGSVFDGEDVVQDTFARAFAALQDLDELPPLRPWLFRIAHNRAVDLLRGRARRAADPMDAAVQALPDEAPGADETLMREEAVRTAVARFVELPTTQRSAVILKDVLDHSLAEIAGLLDLSVDAVKAHLARGRAGLRAINARAAEPGAPRPASAAAVRYATLFNGRDWDGLRALLAEDVRLNQASKPVRVGAAVVGEFFTFYARWDEVRLVPAWTEGREVLAVFDGPDAVRPSYLMGIEWRGERISCIRDFRYARYVVDGAAIELAAPSGAPRVGP
jgi:RNA polymerase sigma factor (sigma-70 family)